MKAPGSCAGGLLRVLEVAHFLEADEAVGAEDDVVDDVDAEYFAGLSETLGEEYVFGAGLGQSGGVVVNEEDGLGALGDCGPEHFAGVDDGCVEGADRDGANSEDAVLGVEQDGAEVLTVKGSHFMEEHVGDVFGSGEVELGSGVEGFAEGGDEWEEGADAAGGAGADGGDGGEFVSVGGEELESGAEVVDKLWSSRAEEGGEEVVEWGSDGWVGATRGCRLLA